MFAEATSLSDSLLTFIRHLPVHFDNSISNEKPNQNQNQISQGKSGDIQNQEIRTNEDKYCGSDIAEAEKECVDGLFGLVLFLIAQRQPEQLPAGIHYRIIG